MVTSSDAFTGENFRRGGYLTTPTATSAPRNSSSSRASSGTAGRPTLWWPIATAASTSTPAASGTSITTAHSSTSAVSRPSRPSPQGTRCCCRPAIPRTAVRSAPSTPTRCSRCTPRWRPVSSTTPTSRVRAASEGRDPDQLKVFPAATFVLGDTTQEAADKARHIRCNRSAGRPRSDARADLAARSVGVRPGRPAADVEPADDPTITKGRVRHGDAKAVAAAWRERAEAENLSIRELVIAVTSRQHSSARRPRSPTRSTCTCRQTPATASSWCRLTPHGLDDFVDGVVPLLQERGSFRTEYAGHTLRDHLGL